MQVAIATEAAQEADGARRAVAEVLEGRRAIAEENIALEEQLLELRNAAAEEQQRRSEMESRIAASAGEVRAAEARAATAAERAEREKARLREEIAALQEGRAGLMGRLKEMAARKGPARAGTDGADAAVDASVQTEDSAMPAGGRSDAACQASVVADALEAARKALGDVGEGAGATEEEEAMLRDPVSARIAEEAAAAVMGQPDADEIAGGADVLQGWLALLPPAGWGDGVAATVADTQHSVLESVNVLLDSLAEERAGMRADLAEKDAQVEALKAALAVVGADVPVFDAQTGEHGWPVNGADGVHDAAGVNGDAAGLPSGVNGEHSALGVTREVGSPAAVARGAEPEIESLGVVGLTPSAEHDTTTGSNGGIFYDGHHAGSAGGQVGLGVGVNGLGGTSGSHSPEWEHVDGIEGGAGAGRASSPGQTGLLANAQDGSPSHTTVPVSVHTTPAKRGWFGGIFGHRTPSPAQTRRSILTSD